MFKKAVKEEAKLRLAIVGPSGSGKTYSSLAIATNLGGKIAFVDTEHGSASKYADIFQFDVLELKPPFHPDKFVEAIKGATTSKYDVVILDSLTHAWTGTGGILDLTDQATLKSRSQNSYFAWRETTPIHNHLIDTILSAGIHVIGTMRSKQEYVIQEVKGKQTPQKVGMAPVQREGMEYEFDIVLEMDAKNNATVTKSRCPALTERVFPKPNGEVSQILSGWLAGEKPRLSAALQNRLTQRLRDIGLNGNILQHVNRALGKSFSELGELNVDEAKSAIDLLEKEKADIDAREKAKKAQEQKDFDENPELVSETEELHASHDDVPIPDSQPKKSVKPAEDARVTKDRAAKLHKQLGGIKIDKDRHYELASAVARREISSFGDLFESEVEEVLEKARGVRDEKLILAEGKLIDADTGEFLYDYPVTTSEKSNLGSEVITPIDELPE